MKKSVAIITAMAAAAMLSIGASAADVSISRLGSSAEIFSETFLNLDVKVSQLSKNRSVKNTLVVAENETLVIPSGCKLTLKSGCRVEGTLYIENGGYLAVSGGELEISGSVVNDGTVSIGEKGALFLPSSGEFYTSLTGEFKSKTEKLRYNENSTIVCLGKTSISGVFEETKKVFSNNAVSAVRSHFNISGIISTEIVGSEEIMEFADAGYLLSDEVPVGGAVEVLTVLFDNGSAIKIQLVDDKIVQIGSAEMRVILKTIE